MKVIQAGQRVNAGQSRSTEGYAVAALLLHFCQVID
jgi:hypothetical protein